MTPDTSNPNEALVAVWRTTEATVLPHVLAALEQAGIDCMVQDRGLATELMGQRSTMTVGETALPLSVLVRQEDEGRARDIVAALLSPVPSAETAVPADEGPAVPETPRSTADASAAEGTGGVDLLDASTGSPLGRLSDAQLAELTTHLELESVDDDDVYIDRPTIDMLQDAGVDAAILQVLTRALGERGSIDVRWRRR